MILWLTGNSGSGKTTIAKSIISKYPSWKMLDGDIIRNYISKDLGFSKKDRIENSVRIAKFAKILQNRNYNIVIASIAPYYHGRHLVNQIIDCTWIYIEGGKNGLLYPYEIPECIKFKSIHQIEDIIIKEKMHVTGSK